MYFDFSVTIKWLLVGLVEGLILASLSIPVFIKCVKNENFGECAVETMVTPMIVISGICFFGMMGVLLEWAYGKRHQTFDWVIDKWNQVNNNVVDFQAPGQEDQNIEVNI